MLEFENMVIEVLLQLLIRKVDAKLFEAVDFEIFKAKDIQHTNEAGLGHVA